MPDRTDPPAYRDLIRVFGRIGLLSFGGPAAQIALMHRELVETRPWLDPQGFLRALSLCMLLPGPEAMQLATYAGWRLRGVPGGLIAGALFVLPGAAVIAALVALYVSFGTLPAVQAAFLGIKAGVIVIVLQALRGLARRALGTRTAWGIAALAFAGIFALNLPFPLILLAAAALGTITAPPGGKADPAPRPVPIGSTLPHTLLRATAWALAWLVPLAALSLAGLELLAGIGWFFAWLAVVTFGGAYAVLAYMTQTVVDAYGWISAPQMIDALGLAETTPGPLILVTQFVAMLAGALQGGFGLALAAGLVALWATFVPCFLWIFTAAPYLERLSDRPRLTAALSGITAAVTGVILNLSLWFALHVLFQEVGTAVLGPMRLPLPILATIDPHALALTLLAALLMLVLRRSIPVSLPVLAAAGLLSGLM